MEFQSSGGIMTEIKAYAKVNLGLDVLGRRENGYHDVKMVMQSVDLYDILTFSVLEQPDIILESDSTEIPLNEDNLIYRACRMVMDRYELQQGVRVQLVKNIPVAAGMAGGSTDCAAAFRGMNELFSLGMTQQEMRDMGVKLGADVPYCIMGGTALSEGIGEVLTPLTTLPACTFLIAKPEFGVSTAAVYKALDAKKLTQSDHPDIDGMVEGLQKQSLSEVVSKMGNILEKVTIPMHPEIQEIKAAMMSHGALNALMSGSGPTVFGIFDDSALAWEALEALADAGLARDLFVVGGTKDEA
jgi:4-diphosphocytidyl-2-C-methyl-D-erythritol kinase